MNVVSKTTLCECFQSLANEYPIVNSPFQDFVSVGIVITSLNFLNCRMQVEQHLRIQFLRELKPLVKFNSLLKGIIVRPLTQKVMVRPKYLLSTFTRAP